MSKKGDGCRAVCPQFESRVDYLAGHWIQCRLGSKGFATYQERDQFYRVNCCGDRGGCPLIEIDNVRRRPKDE